MYYTHVSRHSDQTQLILDPSCHIPLLSAHLYHEPISRQKTAALRMVTRLYGRTLQLLPAA
jgi:hypothetical protein